jgi:acyl-ACP thioesterase
MDPNGHINNVAYLAWAMEVIPDHVYQQYQLSEVRQTLQLWRVAVEIVFLGSDWLL